MTRSVKKYNSPSLAFSTNYISFNEVNLLPLKEKTQWILTKAMSYNAKLRQKKKKQTFNK